MARFEAAIVEGSEDVVREVYATDRSLALRLTSDQGTVELYFATDGLVTIWTHPTRLDVETEGDTCAYRILEMNIADFCSRDVKGLLNLLALQQLEKQYATRD